MNQNDEHNSSLRSTVPIFSKSCLIEHRCNPRIYKRNQALFAALELRFTHPEEILTGRFCANLPLASLRLCRGPLFTMLFLRLPSSGPATGTLRVGEE